MALSWIEGGGRHMPGAGRLTDEEFIVQELKNIRREYRVHTIEDSVIEDLTVHRHQGSVRPGEREAPTAMSSGYSIPFPPESPQARIWGGMWRYCKMVHSRRSK